MRSDTPSPTLAHALLDDTPRPMRHGGNRLSWRHPAACPDPLAHALPDDTPRPTLHDGNQLSWRYPAACPGPSAASKFYRSQSGIAGRSRRAQRHTFPWTHRCAPRPLAYPSPTPSPTTYAARRQPAVVAASSRVSRLLRSLEVLPLPERHRGPQQTCRMEA